MVGFFAVIPFSEVRMILGRCLADVRLHGLQVGLIF